MMINKLSRKIPLLVMVIAILFVCLLSTKAFAATDSSDGVTITYTVERTMMDGALAYKYSYHFDNWLETTLLQFDDGSGFFDYDTDATEYVTRSDTIYIWVEGRNSYTADTYGATLAMYADGLENYIGTDCWYEIEDLGNGTYKLVIDGTGSTFDFDEYSPPWYDTYRNSITEIEVRGISEIGQYLFSSHANTKKIELWETVTSIGGSAFSRCSSVKELVVLGEMDSEWSSEEFEELTSLEIAYINDKYYTSGNLRSILLDCGVSTLLFDTDSSYIVDRSILEGITEITIPATLGEYDVLGIGGCAFEGETQLEKITFLGDYIELIDSSAFAEMTNLKEFISLSSYVDSVESNAFDGCTNLEVAYLGSNTGGLWDTFDTMGVNTLVFDKDTNTITDSNIVGDTYITIPESIAGYDVTTIGIEAFYNCTSLTSVTIPNSVTKIGTNGFQNCTSLTSITIPNSVTTIGASTFSNCTSLTSVTIPDSVTTIGIYTFYGCTSLTSVTIPDSVTTIGNYAFQNCTSLTSVTIPDSVTTIEIQAFDNCSSLTSVTIPNSVTKIGNNAFGYCSSLTSVTALSDSISSIGSNIFNGCTALKVAYLGSSTGGLWDTFDTIGVNTIVFDKDTNTITDSNIVGDTYIVIPESIAGYGVTTIGAYAFSNCTSLTSITIPNSVTTIETGAFVTCSNLTSVTIPNSVTTIGNSAFQNCTSLTSVTIPNGVTTIGDSAFYNCTSLTSITIPNGVTTIGDRAFYRCSIAKIIIPEATVNISTLAFNSDTELCFIADTVPSNIASSGLNYITGYTPFENVNVTADWQTLKAAVSIGEIDKTNTAAYMSWATGERTASYFSDPSTVNSLSENQTISDIAFNNTIVTLFWTDLGGNKVTKVINLTEFYTSTKCENITYGQTLGGVTIVDIYILGKNISPFLGDISYETVSSFKNIKPDAGSRVVDINFTPNNKYAGYSVYSKNMPITVDKVTPTINTKPTASAITYTQTLASSNLSGGSCNYAGTWSWTDGSIKPNAGTRSYSVTFTPTDSVNVKPITADISLSVAKYRLDVSGATASDITYGDTLSKSVISMN